MELFKSISPDAQHVQYLDGLRGIAVLMVLWHHTIFYFHKDFHLAQLRDWLDAGSRGVPLFFILSALTLYASSLKRFTSDNRPITSFYLRRAFRILPFFWLNVFYSAYKTPTSITKILANLTFAFGILNINLFMVPGSWSLFVEETFYLIFPLLFIKYLKDSNWVMFGLLYSVIAKIIWQSWMLSSGHTPDQIEYWASPLNNYYWFFFGILLSKFLLQNEKNKLTDENTIKMPFFFDCLTVLGMAFISRLDDLTVAILLCFLVLTASYRNTLIGKLCRSRLLRLFGISCYSIYFIHFYVILWIQPYFIKEFGSQLYRNLPSEFQYVFFTFLVAAVSLILGLISFNFIEVSTVRIGRRFIRKINLDPILIYKKEKSVLL